VGGPVDAVVWPYLQKTAPSCDLFHGEICQFAKHTIDVSKVAAALEKFNSLNEFRGKLLVNHAMEVSEHT
jgi:hypothetical protein